ncbi:MAG TPA: AraC family transcriptional regulator [Gemmatimonadaceae bacterium]
MHASSYGETETGLGAALVAGEYFGTAAGARSAGAVTLTLTDYAPGTVVPSHAHAHPYFCYVSAGGFAELGEAGSYVASRGTLVFHPAAETHSDEFGGAGGRCFNIEVRDVDLVRDPGVVRGAAVRYAAELYREMRVWDAASAVVAEGLTAALIARVDFDASRADTAPRKARCDIARAVERLRADPCNPPSLALLAAEAGLSTLSFARAFRRQFGCGVGAYVRAERVEMAKRALADSNCTVSTIAADLGFADQAHLTRVFRDATGWTPAAFRREMVA